MRTEPFQTTSGEHLLRGVLHAPQEAGPHPTALLLHGFGGDRREGGLFVRLGRELAAAGVAALCVDRTGQGESDGDFSDVTVARDTADVLAVLDAAPLLDDVDGGDLHLVGLSLGAVVATAVAAQRPAQVRSLTLFSVAASFSDEIASGFLQGRPTEVVSSQGYFDFYGRRLGPAILAEAPAYDVYGTARGYAGPVRALHGTADFIPVSYAERYREVYGDQLDLTVVEGADHGWSSVPVRDLLVTEVVAFVRAHLRTPR